MLYFIKILKTLLNITNNLTLMVYTASLSPTSYIPVPNVTLLRQYLTLLAFDRFHLLDIQLSISGAILTEYR